MIVPEGLMHRKINLLAGVLIILIIAIIAAFAISVEAAFGTGIRVLSPVRKCVIDPGPNPTGCIASCPVCGVLPGCTSLYEVRAQYVGGVNVLFQGQALCLVNPRPPRGGFYSPGGQCLGTIGGVTVHHPINFACTGGR